MTQSTNQFAQTPEKGDLDLRFNTNTISCQIDSSSAGGLLPGQAVKCVDSADGIPKVVECSADTDDVYGFLQYEIRRDVFDVGDVVEVSFARGNVMWMEASAGIARWAPVSVVISGNKVVSASTTKTVIGRAYDKGTTGDLIRVLIDLPGDSYNEYQFSKAATVAAVATADATDLATAEALANQLKVTVNAILTNLKAANLMA